MGDEQESPTPRDGAVILAEMADLLQEFATGRAGEPEIVTASLLSWDQTRFNDEGFQESQVQWTMPKDCSLSTAVGLAATAHIMMDEDFRQAYREEE